MMAALFATIIIHTNFSIFHKKMYLVPYFFVLIMVIRVYFCYEPISLQNESKVLFKLRNLPVISISYVWQMTINVDVADLYLESTNFDVL